MSCAAQCQDEGIAFTPPKPLGMLSASMIALDAAAAVVASSAMRAATAAAAQKSSPGSLVSGTSAVVDAICMVLCAHVIHATCEAEQHVSDVEPRLSDLWHTGRYVSQPPLTRVPAIRAALAALKPVQAKASTARTVQLRAKSRHSKQLTVTRRSDHTSPLAQNLDAVFTVIRSLTPCLSRYLHQWAAHQTS